MVWNTFTNSLLGVINTTFNTVIEGTVDCSQGWTKEAVAVMRTMGFSESQRVKRGWPKFAVPFDSQ